MEEDDLAVGRADATGDVLGVRRGRRGAEVDTAPGGLGTLLGNVGGGRGDVVAGDRGEVDGVALVLEVAHVFLAARARTRGNHAVSKVVHLAPTSAMAVMPRVGGRTRRPALQPRHRRTGVRGRRQHRDDRARERPRRSARARRHRCFARRSGAPRYGRRGGGGCSIIPPNLAKHPGRRTTGATTVREYVLGKILQTARACE